MKLWRIVMMLQRSHDDLQKTNQSTRELLRIMDFKNSEENIEKNKNQRENSIVIIHEINSSTRRADRLIDKTFMLLKQFVL